MISRMFFYRAHPEWLDDIETTGIFDADELARLRDAWSPEEALGFLRAISGVENPTFEAAVRPPVEDLRRLHETGLNLVVGTDTGNDFIFPGLSMHEELELLAMGFTPAELIDRNPLDDIRHTRSIRAVFRGGQQQPPGPNP